MTPPELARLKARVTPTICETWGQNEHDGAMSSRIEVRISADDFMRLCAVAESAAVLIGDATADMGRAIAAEREACARIASGMFFGDDCDDRGMQDPETGEIPCSAERRGEVCVCVELSDLAHRIATRIRARSA